MKSIIVIILLVAAGWYGYQTFHKGGGGSIGSTMTPGITLETNRLLMKRGDLEAEFERSATFSGSFMLFGGRFLADKNAVSPVSLAGLSMPNAKRIYAQYPDFHLCKSPGASMAKPLIEDLNIISANSSVLATLRESIEKHKQHVASGGDQVCIKMNGERVTMQTVRIPAANKDVTHAYPDREFYYITDAELMNCKSELETDS